MCSMFNNLAAIMLQHVVNNGVPMAENCRENCLHFQLFTQLSLLLCCSYLDIRLTTEATEANPSIMTYCEVPLQLIDLY